MELFVSLTGNDKNDGSIENPLRTLDGAKKLIKSLSPKEDVCVYLRGGRYFFRDTFSITKDDSLQDGYKLTFGAYGDEKVYFDGGVAIEGKNAVLVTDEKILSKIIDEEARKHIFEVDLSDCDITYRKYGTRGFGFPYAPSMNELFIDAVPQKVSRYPNEGENPIPLDELVDGGSKIIGKDFSCRPAVIKYKDSRCDKWENASDFYISGVFNWSFGDSTIEVAKLDTKNKTITTKYPNISGFEIHDYTYWYALNLLEEIDIPGEYYISSENKKVYFYPQKDIKDSLIQISVMSEPIVAIEGGENIIFKNITFENTCAMAIYLEDSKNCLIDGCVIRNTGMHAIQVGQGAATIEIGKGSETGLSDEIEPLKPMSRTTGSWSEMMYMYPAWDHNGGENNGIINCDIYNAGGGGVILTGGNRKNLIPAGNYIHNCEIHHINRIDRTYKGGVNICGVGNKISHCKMHDMAGFAVLIHGNDHIIEYSEIYNVLNEVSDAGAIYMGRDLSEAGNEIRYNFFHDISGKKDFPDGACAIYFDDYCSFNSAYKNYFYRITAGRKVAQFGAILMNRGGHLSINNNLFIDCHIPFRPIVNNMNGIGKMVRETHPLLKKRLHTTDENDLGGVDITTEVWREKYPAIYDMYTGNYKDQPMIWNNAAINEDLTPFVDPENLDFTIKEGEASHNLQWIVTYNVIDPMMGIEYEEVKFFETVPFKEIGLISENNLNPRSE